MSEVTLWTAGDGYCTDRYYQARLELFNHNRRILSKRLGWPEGALEVCERLSAENPGWYFNWTVGNTLSGWERPAGFQFQPPEKHYHGNQWRYCKDEEELVRRVAEYKDSSTD